LVVGYNTRHIVCSAKRAGFHVESVSYYEDSDLIKCGVVTHCFRDESPGVITDTDFKSLKALVTGIPYDHAILATGFETLDIPKVAGNPPHRSSFVNDKNCLRDKLESLDYLVPQRFDLEDNPSFPLILKPKGEQADLGTFLLEINNTCRGVLSSFTRTVGTIFFSRNLSKVLMQARRFYRPESKRSQ
jgi:predicted ATP-grasp superfamily ATP-dependent carboligase